MSNTPQDTSVQETTATPEQPAYSDKPFDWRSVSNDMKAMRNMLLEDDKTEAATLCDNAYRMIVRLWTINHEAGFSLTVAMGSLTRHDLDAAKNSLKNVRETLNISTEMMPAKQGREGLVESVRALAQHVLNNTDDDDQEATAAAMYAMQVLARIDSGEGALLEQLPNIQQRLRTVLL